MRNGMVQRACGTRAEQVLYKSNHPRHKSAGFEIIKGCSCTTNIRAGPSPIEEEGSTRCRSSKAEKEV
jgi:hypothetical protein